MKKVLVLAMMIAAQIVCVSAVYASPGGANAHKAEKAYLIISHSTFIFSADAYKNYKEKLKAQMDENADLKERRLSEEEVFVSIGILNNGLFGWEERNRRADGDRLLHHSYISYFMREILKVSQKEESAETRLLMRMLLFSQTSFDPKDAFNYEKEFIAKIFKNVKIEVRSERAREILRHILFLDTKHELEANNVTIEFHTPAFKKRVVGNIYAREHLQKINEIRGK
ncbi:hypothetical protein Dip518_001181 [Parelusimicrobium proximum]|uniref:hypothetical protein n=1 Tax=Parelusimicrobium proximum TaxID=3228953 RepID=UPI003D16B3AD